MFKESDVATPVDDHGPEEETKIIRIRFINGLIDDTINEWEWRSPMIKLIRQASNVEENLSYLREPVQSYDERLLRYSDEVDDPVRWVHSNPESSEEAIARYDALAEDYNQLIEAPEPDLKALARVVKAACALYGREARDL